MRSMIDLLKQFCGNKYVQYLLLCLLVFMVGFVCCYQKYVPAYKRQLAVLTATVKDYRERSVFIAAVKNSEQQAITYVPKVNGEKTDVEITDAENKIIVKYNGQETVFQPQLEETQKFEQGKLVIDRSQQTVLDMTEAFNKAVAAEAKSKNRQRLGKVDFGTLYNIDNGDAYAGIRYNAKMFDIGAYHGVGNSDVIIGIHGKF